MKLAAMVAREDFYSILSASVETYFQKVHNKTVEFSYEKSQSSERLIVNGTMSFISRFPAPAGVRRFLLAEYNIRGNRLKFLAGKAAALLGSTLPQVGMLRYAYITRGALGKHTFISPQNRSIRFFDYDSMTVDCIIKAGFTDKYFANQLSFRKQYDYDFMLPLLDSGEDWFRERIMTGHALVRVTDAEAYEKGMTDALQGIARLSRDTLSVTDSVAYASDLLQQIRTLLQQARQRKGIACADQTEKIAAEAWQVIAANPMELPLCMSHGDLQGGNIWLDEEGKVWIYDWETAGRRSVWYDSAVLSHSLRRAYGWQSLWTGEPSPAVFTCDPVKHRSSEEWAAIKRILLLEDILFYLEDMLELPEDWGAAIYDGFARRMTELLTLEA